MKSTRVKKRDGLVPATTVRLFAARELFAVFRANAANAEAGAMTYTLPGSHDTLVPAHEHAPMHEHFALTKENK